MNRPKCKRCRNKSSTLLRSRTITTDEYCCWECWRLDILSVKVTLNPKLCVKCGQCQSSCPLGAIMEVD